MTGSHKTSAIARPNGAAAPVREPRPVRRDRSLLDDFTRPVEAEHRLVTSRSNRWVLGLLAVAVVGALLAALFVLPVQAWMRQQDEIAVKEQELSVLTDANEQLAADVQHLQTLEGAREAARDELGVIVRGEERISIMPSAPGALPLPTGWPYDTVTQIVAVRATPPTTVPPATVPPPTAAPVTSVVGAPIDPAALDPAVVDPAVVDPAAPVTTVAGAPVEQVPVPAMPTATTVAVATTVGG